MQLEGKPKLPSLLLPELLPSSSLEVPQAKHCVGGWCSVMNFHVTLMFAAGLLQWRVPVQSLHPPCPSSPSQEAPLSHCLPSLRCLLLHNGISKAFILLKYVLLGVHLPVKAFEIIFECKVCDLMKNSTFKLFVQASIITFSHGLKKMI